MSFATFPTPDHWLTPGQLSETEALIRWDLEAMIARQEAEDNTAEIEAMLASERIGMLP